MELLDLIKECIRDCSDLIVKKIEESDTLIDDLLLEKILWFFKFLKARF